MFNYLINGHQLILIFDLNNLRGTFKKIFSIKTSVFNNIKLKLDLEENMLNEDKIYLVLEYVHITYNISDMLYNSMLA